MTVPSFAQIVGRAKSLSGRTAAEFDYDLAYGEGYTPAGVALGQVVGEAVKAGADREALNAQVAQLIVEAKAKRYTGWSTAARARGHRIRYADA